MCILVLLLVGMCSFYTFDHMRLIVVLNIIHYLLNLSFNNAYFIISKINFVQEDTFRSFGDNPLLIINFIYVSILWIYSIFFVSLFRKLWPLNYTLVQVKLPEKTS